MQILFLSPDLVIRIILGFAVGALIGLERQKRMRDDHSLGVRSFGLHSLLGCLAAYSFIISGNPLVLFYATAVSLIILAAQISYKLFRTMRKGMTTSIVFALSFVLGALVGLDAPPTPPNLIGPLQLLAMTISFMVFLVLGFKEELASAVAMVERDELISAAELGVIILFLWPLIPQSIMIGPIDFPVFQIYILVVILLSISFANYILVKKYKDKGTYFFGLFGGFANSEATVTSLTDFHCRTGRKHPDRIAVSAMFANLAMVIRNAALILIIDPSVAILRFYAVPVIILISLGFFRGLHVRRSNIIDSEEDEEIDTTKISPFEFTAALRFAIVFTGVSLVSLLLQEFLSDAGILLAAIIGGFASAGAVVAVAALAYTNGTVILATAVFAVIIATTMSVLNKIIYVYAADRDHLLAKKVAMDSLTLATGVLVYILLLASGLIQIF
ncbi:MAG: conserved membrane protein of unknown function [Candidatus Thorarchaeota archaeon]|nr:MAG: conserved membrane protein of unknown function [Candidatus Thorarchaeota archaeon]